MWKNTWPRGKIKIRKIRFLVWCNGSWLFRTDKELNTWVYTLVLLQAHQALPPAVRPRCSRDSPML